MPVHPYVRTVYNFIVHPMLDFGHLSKITLLTDPQISLKMVESHIWVLNFSFRSSALFDSLIKLSEITLNCTSVYCTVRGHITVHNVKNETLMPIKPNYLGLFVYI